MRVWANNSDTEYLIHNSDTEYAYAGDDLLNKWTSNGEKKISVLE